MLYEVEVTADDGNGGTAVLLVHVTVTSPSDVPAGDNDTGSEDINEDEQDTSSTPDDTDQGGGEEDVLGEDVLAEDVLEEDVSEASQGPVNKKSSQGGSTANAPRVSLNQVSRDLSLNSLFSIDLKDVIESLSTSQTIQNEAATSVLTQERNVRQGHLYEALSARLYEHLRNSLDALKEEGVSEIKYKKALVSSAIAVSTGLSVGYVVWLIRGGMLLTSLLSSMPAWRILDPLPILAGRRDDSDTDEEESLDTIIDKGSRDDEEQKQEVRLMNRSRDSEAPEYEKIER